VLEWLGDNIVGLVGADEASEELRRDRPRSVTDSVVTSAARTDVQTEEILMRRTSTVSRSLALAVTLGAAMTLSVASGAFAASNPAGTGQPGAECGDEGAELEPTGFFTDGFALAETMYAGSDGTHSLNSNNEHAVSQYDVACFQFTSSH
jgi:hypothetical protein